MNAILKSIEAAEPTRDNAPRIELRCGSDIRSVPIRLLWPGWLARGKLHILAGAPGTGKTTVALALAAAVTRGGSWPSGTSAPVGNVLIWSAEDDAADTMMPRLRAAGADASRIFIVGDYSDGMDKRAFDPAADIDLLEQEAERIGNVVLLIADPVVSAVTGDSHKNTEVRRALQPIVDLASRLDAAVLGITHFSKGGAGKDPAERVTGSIAFGALPRVVMVTAKRTDAEAGNDARLLARAKSNIGPDGGGFAYALEQVEHDGLSASVVRFGAALDGSAKELLGDAEGEADDDAGEQHDAADWLRDVLLTGPMPVKDVKRHANDSGFAWRSAQRAMRRAGVESKRGGFGQRATWRLASCATTATVARSAPSNLSGATGATGESEGANQAGGMEVIEL
jgi:putative DNA primase/helicase